MGAMGGWAENKHLGELCEIVCLHDATELVHVWEVANGQRVGAVHLEEVLLEVVEQLRLRLVLPEHGGHLLLEVADDVGVRLGEPHTLHELVDLAHRRVLGHVLQVGEQVAHLGLEELPAPLVPLKKTGIKCEIWEKWGATYGRNGCGGWVHLERLVPEGADVDTHALWALDHLGGV